MSIWLSRFLPLGCLFITMLLGVAAYNKGSKPIKIMALLSVFVFVYEAAGHWLGYRHKNNLWLYNFSSVIFTAGICYYYYQSLLTAGYKNWVKWLSFIYLVVNIPLTYNYTFGSQGLNTPGITVSGILVILCSLFYLLEQNKSDTTQPLSHNPLYYFCIAFIIFHCILILVNGMYNFLLQNYFSRQLDQFIVYLSLLASVLYNLLISSGFVCCLRNTKYI